jgi:predicted PurR-regulated permease PerM
MGGLMGILGLFIGVPIFAVIYYLVKTITENRLSKKSLPTDTESYKKEEQL